MIYCDISYDIGEYLDYSNCKFRKKLVDTLIEQCTENIDVVKIDNENENENENKYSFCKVCIVCIVLFSVILAISIGIGIYFVYYHWYLKKI